MERKTKERPPAAPLKKPPNKIDTNLPADETVPNRFERPSRVEICFGSYGPNECVRGHAAAEQVVSLKLVVVLRGVAAVPDEHAFRTDEEIPKLQIKSGLDAAHGCALRVVVARCMERRQNLCGSQRCSEVVELVGKIDIGRLFTGIEMVPAAADVDATVPAAPVGRVLHLAFREEIRSFAARGRRGCEAKRFANYFSTDGQTTAH